jgi:hypothetical protein
MPKGKVVGNTAFPFYYDASFLCIKNPIKQMEQSDPLSIILDVNEVLQFNTEILFLILGKSTGC